MMLTKALTIAAATIIYNTSTLQAYTPNSSFNSNRNSIKMSDKYNNIKGGIICAGLSCLDLQLVGCTQSGSDEAIERYDEAVHCAGGSASMTGTTLALLLRQSDDDDTKNDEQREKVHILTKVGPDFAGNTLLEFYRRAGASTDLVLRDDSVRTSMAVLPIYNNGKRGCFVNLACNDGFTSDELLNQLYIAGEDNTTAPTHPTRAFLFGYPHLMPEMQGDSLRDMLQKARQKLSLEGSNSVLVGVDLNGVDGSDSTAAREALMPSLCEIDVLHLNEDEVMVLSQHDKQANEDTTKENDVVSSEMLSQISSFHEKGCAVVLLSLGSKGAFVSVTPDTKRLQRLSTTNNEQQPIAISQWIPGTQVRIPAFQIDGEVNANGAGDALFAGLCLAASSWGSAMEQLICKDRSMSSNDEGQWKVSPQVAGTFASLVAWQRCNAKTRDGDGMKSATQLMQLIYEDNLPCIL